MAVETFPGLAISLIYTVLCLVSGFLTLKTAQYLTPDDVELELDQVDKSLWRVIGTGISLSVLYFVYVAWMGVTTGEMALVVPIDLQWTELVAVYPFLLVVGVLGRGVLTRTQRRSPLAVEREQSSD